MIILEPFWSHFGAIWAILGHFWPLSGPPNPAKSFWGSGPGTKKIYTKKCFGTVLGHLAPLWSIFFLKKKPFFFFFLCVCVFLLCPKSAKSLGAAGGAAPVPLRPQLGPARGPFGDPPKNSTRLENVRYGTSRGPHIRFFMRSRC